MVEIRGDTDGCLQAVADALAKYEQKHPGAAVEIYRQNSVSIRARIVDPHFDGISKSDRHDLVWDFVKSLPEEQQSEISVLLLLAPGEQLSSFANQEFDHPIPSNL